MVAADGKVPKAVRRDWRMLSINFQPIKNWGSASELESDIHHRSGMRSVKPRH